MSAENVEIVRKAHAARNARDLEEFVRCCDPEVAYQSGLEGAVEGRGGTGFQGHEGLRRWWRQQEEDWAEWSSEITAMRDLGDTLIVDCILRLRARATGIPFEASFVQVITLRNGLIVRGDDYLDRVAALGAAGLAEDRDADTSSEQIADSSPDD
jgi:ketosteroid isomerase-like protein